MGWQLGIKLDQRRRNLRIAKMLQTSQELGPKALRGFLLKQTEKNRNSRAHVQIGQRCDQDLAVWFGQALVTDQAQSRRGCWRYFQPQRQAHPCGIGWLVSPDLR